MSKLERFIGKPIKKVINGEELDIYPLAFSDTDLLLKLADNDTDKRTVALRELIKKSLKRSIPDATDEEIEKLDFRYFGDLIAAVFEASGLDIDKKKLDDMTASLTQTT